MSEKVKNSIDYASAIKDLLSKIKNVNLERETLIHKLENEDHKIFEIKEEVDKLTSEHKCLKQTLESKKEGSKENQKVLKDLNNEKTTLQLKVIELQKKQKKMKRTKCSINDEQTIEKGRRKLALYKEFTGIRWDVFGSESKREGLITDKKKYVHKLSYDKDLDMKILNDRFWDDVYQCGKAVEVNNLYREEK